MESVEKLGEWLTCGNKTAFGDEADQCESGGEAKMPPPGTTKARLTAPAVKVTERELREVYTRAIVKKAGRAGSRISSSVSRWDFVCLFLKQGLSLLP